MLVSVKTEDIEEKGETTQCNPPTTVGHALENLKKKNRDPPDQPGNRRRCGTTSCHT